MERQTEYYLSCDLEHHSYEIAFKSYPLIEHDVHRAGDSQLPSNIPDEIRKYIYIYLIA